MKLTKQQLKELIREYKSLNEGQSFLDWLGGKAIDGYNWFTGSNVKK